MIRGAFIGIDKHRDEGIRELTGARRDATALWALFQDSLPEISASLLVDQEATREGVREAFDATMDRAGPEDTVVLSFSGHGTHDHHLVVHDTSVDELLATTLPMEELASRFRRSQAKTILCILDCCFSGGAPARVLEDSPIPRAPGTPFEALVGNGRVLIAASNVNERAFELPGTRHGLLTDALLHVLQNAEPPINILDAMGAVLDRVRAEAARISVVQTPVLLGYVEGGLILPQLVPGAHYFTAFPERRGARVGRAISDLAAFGIPTHILTEWSERLPTGLNDLQLLAVNDYRALDGQSLLVIAPTSAGKTFIGEMAAARAIVDGRKAVFLLPYRALVNEKYDQFGQLYRERLGMRVIRCTGDYVDQTDQFVRGRYDLALLTYEMFLNLVLANPSAVNQFGLVVLDEAQFITDQNRGITVELLLTYLLSARRRGIQPQLIALSAVIGDAARFDEWLGCRVLVTHERPVPLTEGVLDRTGIFMFLNSEGQVRNEQLLRGSAVVMRRDEPRAQDILVPLARALIERGETLIIFRNQRGSARGAAQYVASELRLPPAANALQALPTHDLSSTSLALREVLQGGVAFHTSDLNRDERAVVERAFRDPHGGVNVLVATTTVAAGINTPASTVVLAEQEFIGEDGRPFTIAEYKNMAGRAGRVGFREVGRSIILAQTGYQREELFTRYVRGEPEPLRSSFDPANLETWVIRLLAQVERVPTAEVSTLLANTFGGYVANQRNPAWQREMAGRIEGFLQKMLRLELAEEDAGFVQLTLLGRACGRSSLAFSSAMRLVELLRALPPHLLTHEALMALIQTVPESDAGFTPLMRRGQREAIRPRQAAERYGHEVSRLLQRRAGDQWEYYGRCKRAAILWDWIQGMPVDEIERNYSPNPIQGLTRYGDIRRFADATRFHLGSAHALASLIFIESAPDEEAIGRLLRRLEVGIPEDILPLLEIPLGLNRGEYLALRERGIRTPDQLWQLSMRDVESLLGRVRAAELERMRRRVA